MFYVVCLFYYNIFLSEILNEGLDKAITIGIAPSFYEANRQPGWNRNSFAYHADDGGYVQREICMHGVPTCVFIYFKNG